MQSFRIAKTKPRKSSKPVQSETERLNEVADSISTQDNEAMVSCTECINRNKVCYYDREQSVKCAECLRGRRTCDGTFALEEFRRVGEQKKHLKSKALAKRREALRLRKTLMDARKAMLDAEQKSAAAESEEADLLESLAALEDKSSRMLKREMQALGVMNPLDNEQEVALAEPDFVWSEMPLTESIDWEGVFGSDGGIVQPSSGESNSVACL